MAQMRVAILNIESSTITALLGEKDTTGKLIFTAIATEEYEGFEEGEFIDDNSAINAITKVCNKLMRGYKITNFVIGVTGEFLKVVVKDSSKQILAKATQHKITMEEAMQAFDKINGYTYIYHSSLNLPNTSSKIGQVVNPMRHTFSVYYAKNKFMHLVAAALAELKIKNLTFLPICLAETNYIVPEKLRQNGAILLDIDHLSMTFSVIEGGGITYQTACSMGGGHLLLSLYTDNKTTCQIPFEIVESMVSKINLIQPEQEGACIEFIDSQQTYYMPIKQLKETLIHGLDILCEVIMKCYELSHKPQISYYPILLTGCGIADIQGVKEYLSMRLNKQIAILVPTQFKQAKASQSALISLLNMGIEENKTKNIFHKILSKIGGRS